MSSTNCTIEVASAVGASAFFFVLAFITAGVAFIHAQRCSRAPSPSKTETKLVAPDEVEYTELTNIANHDEFGVASDSEA